jgi:Fe-S cluster assembly protein SufD
MAKAIDTYDRYAADFERLRHGGPDWLRELRSSAFNRFQEIGFPVARKGNEAWKYTDVRPIAAEAFAYAQPQPTRRTTAVRLNQLLPFDNGFARIAVVDGRFAPEFSTGLDYFGLEALSLSQAIDTQPEIVRRHLAQQADWQDDAFAALNTAFVHDGVFIHAKLPVEQPVHVVYVSAGNETAVTHPRALVVAAPLSRIAFIETFLSIGERRHFTNGVTEIAIGDGASVDHYRLLLENQQSFHVGATRVSLGPDSSYSSLSYEVGGGLVRHDIGVLLGESGSSASVNGLYITSGDQHVDNMINIDHAAPHTTSRLYYKGILDDRSRAVFGGTVFVRKGADKTDAHQEDKNLLLSHEAEVNSKPALEIYADDVKAGHGATAGAIADEALFYMRSRGLDEDTAMQFLVRGFAAEIIDNVTIDPLREWLEGQALASLPRFRGEEVGA